MACKRRCGVAKGLSGCLSGSAGRQVPPGITRLVSLRVLGKAQASEALGPQPQPVPHLPGEVLVASHRPLESHRPGRLSSSG